MTDIQHEKYAALINKVETLEDALYALEQAKGDPDEITALQEQLGEARVHLSRVSDGCGPSRSPGA